MKLPTLLLALATINIAFGVGYWFGSRDHVVTLTGFEQCQYKSGNTELYTICGRDKDGNLLHLHEPPLP